MNRGSLAKIVSVSAVGALALSACGQAGQGGTARKSVLEDNDIRIPTVDEPWTIDEFDAALAALQDAGYDTPLDVDADEDGEWWPYAFSPMLQSSGGDLIDRDTMLTAEGALNGPEAVEFFTWFQDAFAKGWTSRTS